MRRSSITSKFVRCSSGDVNVFQWKREWFFSWQSTWWLYMKFLDMDQKSFIASPASGSESRGGWGRDPSDSPRKSFDLLLELGDPVPSKVGVLSSWSPPESLIRPCAAGKWIFHFLWEMLLPLHWVFYTRFLMRPSCPTPQCLQPLCHPSNSPRVQSVSKEQSR